MEKQENLSELQFNQINEYSTKRNYEYNFQNYDNETEEKLSEVLLNDKSETFNLQKKFAFRNDIQIEDWRLNLLEVNVDNGFILFASFKNIFIIKYNRTKRNREKMLGNKKTLATLNANINQIKLINLKQKIDGQACDYYDKENNTYYTVLENDVKSNESQNEKSISNSKDLFHVCAVDMSGYLHVINFSYDSSKDSTQIIFHKIFNCKIIHNDNSIWSVDCFFPYVVVGGNHKSIFLIDLNDQTINDGEEIKNNIILLGNKHNIPYVCFSPDGEFICSNSVDSHPKIWEKDSGRLISILVNDVTEMGWTAKFIKKECFIYEEQKTIKTSKANEIKESSNTNVSQQQNENDIPHQSNDQSETLETVIEKFIHEFQDEEVEQNTFTQDYIDKVNFQNMNSEDKIDEKDFDKIFFNKSTIKANLEKYFVVSTYKSKMVLNSFKIKIFKETEEKKETVNDNNNNNNNNINYNSSDENRIENAISITFNDKNSKDYLKEEKEKAAYRFQNIVLTHGKVDLLKNFLKEKFKNSPLNHETKNLIFGYVSSSRYEFIYFSHLFNMLIIGNRCGDFHFYLLRMIIKFDKKQDENIKDEEQIICDENKDDYQIEFDDKPVFILSHTYKICGFKVIEFKDDENMRNSFIEMYFMDLQGRLECYKLNYLIN